VGSERKIEVAITGTALPILLIAEPNDLKFGSCHVGEKQILTTVLRNDSDLKDIKFRFKKVANFTVQPASGRIAPHSSSEILVSFIPHQIGKTLRHLSVFLVFLMALVRLLTKLKRQ
jgi:hypothetical protein